MRAFAVLGLIVFLSLIGGPARAFSSNCETTGYIATFDARFVPQPCEEIGQVTLHYSGRTSTIRFLRTASDWHGDDAYWLGMAQHMVDRLGRAMTEMGGLKIQPFVSVMLSPVGLTAVVAGDTYTAHATTPGRAPEECQVNFYKADIEISADQFAYTLAHELFHCITFATYPDVVYGADVQWWFEGTAEYFASLVSPDVRVRQSAVARFDPKSLNERLIDMGYESQVFFFGIANRSGPRGVAELFHGFGSAGNGDTFDIAQRVISPEQWITFVEDYLDGQVTWPNGDPIAAPTEVREETAFPPMESFMMETDFLKIDRIKARFARDTHLTITLPPPQEGLTVRTAEEGGNAWGDILEAFDTCDAVQNRLIYATSVVGPATPEYPVEVSELGPEGCCLVGEWAPTEESLEGQARMSEEIAPILMAFGGDTGTTSCGHRSGDWRLMFRDDGTATLAFNNQTTGCTLSTPKGDIDTLTIVRGMADFDWQVREEGVAAAWYGETSVTTEGKVTLGGLGVQALPPTEDFPPFLPGAFSFSCTADSLKIKGLYGLSAAVEAEHSRVAPP
ncbi:MAG: hypothetical protein ACKO1H_16595 [Tabrizicola sp.]